MRITRREFFKYCTIAAGALGLTSSDLLKLKDIMAKEGSTPVIWLQGASCTGDSTSLLNTIFYTDPVGLLVTNDKSSSLDLQFHQTVMNASGSDLIGAAQPPEDAIDAAQSVLSGSSSQTYAIWSSETWSGGSESIKMSIEHRNINSFQAYAEITPESPVLINEFNLNFKFKTGESQAPFVEIDVQNQDTGATATLLSCYPSSWDDTTADGDPKEGRWEQIHGPTDWATVTLSNLPYWQATKAGLPTPTPPVMIDASNDSGGTIPHGVDGVGPPAVGLLPGQPPVREGAATFYPVGAIRMDPSETNPIWLECVTAGTSSGAPLVWPLTTGVTLTDGTGTLKWRAIAASPALISYEPTWTKWYDLRDEYGTWEVQAVRIIDQGDVDTYADTGTDFTESCTMYVDDIYLAGVSYPDRSDLITLWPGVVAAGAGFVLVVEGSVVTGTPKGGDVGGFCEVGPMALGLDPAVTGLGEETMLNAFLTYARQASAVVAVGTCASFGGIPKLAGAKAGEPGALGCAQVLKKYGIKTPVINVPGCPAHPDWIVGTLVAFLVRGLDGISLDKNLRPLDFYGGYVCNGNEGQVSLIPDDNACPWRYNNDGFINTEFPKRGGDGIRDDSNFPIGDSRGLAKYKWGSVPVGEEYWDETSGTQAYSAGHMFEGCLGVLGCRGRKTHADCAYRKWNAATTLTPGTLGVNWCVGSRGGCQGCTEPDFPMLKRFYTFV